MRHNAFRPQAIAVGTVSPWSPGAGVLLFCSVSSYSQCEFQSVQQIISGWFDLSIRLGKFATHRSNKVGTVLTSA
jgi:hypothetical protein